MGQILKRYCVWENGTDRVIAIDLPATKCAECMGVSVRTFYTYQNRQTRYTIIESKNIFESEESA